MPVPPILILTSFGFFTIIGGITPLLTATGQVLNTCVGGVGTLIGIPFSCVSTLGTLLATYIIPNLAF